MIPQVGDVVLVLMDPAVNNGSDVAPGVLTRVWAPGAPVSGPWGDYYTVNARAFADSGGDDQWLRSAALYADEATARTCQQANPTSRLLFPRSAVVR